MAGQDNFPSNYNYAMRTFDNTSAALSDHSLYPIDYRQFPGLGNSQGQNSCTGLRNCEPESEDQYADSMCTNRTLASDIGHCNETFRFGLQNGTPGSKYINADMLNIATSASNVYSQSKEVQQAQTTLMDRNLGQSVYDIDMLRDSGLVHIEYLDRGMDNIDHTDFCNIGMKKMGTDVDSDISMAGSGRLIAEERTVINDSYEEMSAEDTKNTKDLSLKNEVKYKPDGTDSGSAHTDTSGNVKESELEVKQELNKIEDDDGDGDMSDASTVLEDQDEIDEILKKTTRANNLDEQEVTSNKQELKLKLKLKTKFEYTCETCGKVVKSVRALERHINLHTGKFTCNICNKSCNSEFSLKNHIKVHEGFIGDQVCNVCDKKFYDKSSLNKHTLSVHMGIKNFQCEHCNLSFYARKTFDEHVRVHTGERPFKCNICPKTYKRIADLNHHIRLHKGEVSHTCEKCGEGFRRQSELKRHMQKHANDGPLTWNTKQVNTEENRCEWCSIIFITRRMLNLHVKTHMGNISQRMSAALPLGPFDIDSEKQKYIKQIEQELGPPRAVEKEHGEQTKGFPLGSSCSIFQAQDLSVRNEALIKEDNMYESPGFDMNSFEGVNPYIDSIEEQEDDNKLGVNKLCIQKAPNIAESVKNDKTCNEELKLNKREPLGEESKISAVFFKKDSKTPNVSNDMMDENNDKDTELVMVEVDMNDYGGDTDIEDHNTMLEKSDQLTNNTLKLDQPESQNVILKEEAELESDSDAVPDDTNDPDFDPNIGTSETDDQLANDNNKQKSKFIQRKRKLKNHDASEFENIFNDKKSVRKRKSKMNRKNDGDNTDKSENETDNPDFNLPKVSNELSGININTKCCEFCRKLFKSKSSLIKHRNLHTGAFTCGVCSKSFSSQVTLDIHVSNHEGLKTKDAICNVCDKAFYDQSSLNKHVKTVHMDYKPYSCEHCEMRFSERKTMTEHTRVHTGERPFTCEICGKTFKRVSELNFHLRKHRGDVKINCSECGKGFLRQGQLRTHIYMRHNKDNPFRCDMCGKRFAAKTLQLEHMSTHSMERKFVCQKCGRGFFKRSKLNKHLKIKSDCSKRVYDLNGVYTCKFCFLEFESTTERNSHIKQVHVSDADLKIFGCTVCGKDFARRQALKRHLKIHAQVRDFKCGECGSAFIQKHHLDQHIRTHTGEKPYQCSICLKGFAQNATLYSHMKHHNKSTYQE